MAYVPGCRADVFISYALKDNLSAWVTRVKEKLAAKLSMHLGERVHVWSDDRLDPGDKFDQKIRDTLEKTPVLVAVVSPNYLQSPYCMEEELDWFRDQPRKRIVQLVMVGAPDVEPEVPLPDVNYVKLYDDVGAPLTGARLDKQLSKVALAMRDKLVEYWNDQPRIFVAQIKNESLRVAWDGLKEGLHEGGYAIRPSQVLIGGVPDLSIEKWLAECRLSLHLSGVPDDPLASRQLEIARRIAKPMRVLESPPRGEAVDEIIGGIERDLQGPRRPTLYLVYEREVDGATASRLAEQIREKTGLEVVTPGDSERYHKDRLKASEGILFYRSRATEGWLRAQEQALVQAMALRRDRRVTVARYLARPAEGEPAGVRHEEQPPAGWLIERIGDAEVGDLAPFLDELARTKTTLQ